MSKAKKRIPQEELFDKLTKKYVELTQNTSFEPKLYKKGTLIFKQGSIPRGIYYIKSGWVKVFKTNPEGDEKVLRLVTKNQLIGHLSLIKRWNYLSSSIAVTDCYIYFIPKQVFFELLLKDNDFTSLILEMLANELTETETHINTLLSKNIEQRIANLFLSLEQAADHDTSSNDNHITLPKKDLAAIINIAPETFSRYLKILNDKNIIKNSPDYIELLNRHELLKKSSLED